jgi:hypothetical protein
MFWNSRAPSTKIGAYISRLNVLQAVIILEIIHFLQHQQSNKINDNGKII